MEGTDRPQIVDVTDATLAGGELAPDALLRLAIRAARSWGRDRDEVDDLAAATVERVLRRPAGSISHPVSYVWRATRNVAIDDSRRRRREVPSVPAVQEPTVEGFEGAVADRELVERLLAEVSDLDRRILTLRYLEHRPEGQVAAILGVSVATVKSRAHRALRALRRSPAAHVAA